MSTGWERGIPEARLRELARYRRTEFDGWAQEAKLNAFPRFTTEIDGQNIHFLHVRSPRPAARPLLITHGFPSSVAEFLGLIGLLTDPAEGPAFHVIAPSLPRYALSTPLSGTGWTPSAGRARAIWRSRIPVQRRCADPVPRSGVSPLPSGRRPRRSR
ncbi:epoxide hydrolase N-terminal domain-containing protein [Nocardia sp. NPDC059764]|uniref:epoxide hydrolase N-terminal domain-containing protein n=1 Tax=Nocardia sp. NPDC059764 TaxID=3346939 RepID=UPI00364642BC